MLTASSLCIFPLMSLAIALPYLDPSLSRTLRSSDSANILISFKQGTRPVLDSISKWEFSSRSHRISAIAHALQLHAESSQANVLKFLGLWTSPPLQFESFWISNQVFIQNVNLSTVKTLMTFEGISEIYEEEFWKLDSPLEVFRSDP